MMRRACVGASVLACGALVRAEELHSFDGFLRTHGRTYASGSAEYEKRKEIFEVNRQKVIAHNKEYEAGIHSWYMSLNHLSDLTTEEFQKLRGGVRNRREASSASSEKTRSGLRGSAEAAAPNPESIDWRTRDVVTPVKDQGPNCGACWAFAAAETMESHYAIATGNLVELSPQAYVNCANNSRNCGGTGGCGGATPELAFNMSMYLGLPLETELPYQESDETCTEFTAAVKNEGWVRLPENDAEALETALATKGPIGITLAAIQIQLYGGGIFEGCTGDEGSNLNHLVQAVGYTPEYWIVRNSWGTGWGEQGYIRISRAYDNVTSVDKTPEHGVACEPYPETQIVAGMCGMLADSSYPTGMTAVSADSQEEPNFLV